MITRIIFFAATALCMISSLHAEFISPQQALADLQFLRQRLDEIHPNLFLHHSPTEAETKFEAIKDRVTGEFELTQFYKLVSEYVTFFEDGHSYPSMEFAQRAFQKSLQQGNSILPVEFDFRDDYLYVKRCFTTADLTGAKLVSVNGRSVARIVDAFQKFYAKKTSKLDNAHCRMFRSYFWLSFGNFLDWRLEVRSGEGVRVVQLPGYSVQEYETAIQQAMPPTDSRETGDYSFRFIDDDAMALLTVNGMADLRRFRDFAAQAFREIATAETQNLVIDMRNNGGGTSAIGDELMAYLREAPYREGAMQIKISQPIVDWYRAERQNHPFYETIVNGTIGELKTITIPDAVPRRVENRFRGRCFLLTSRKTYSSGHMFAGTFKCNNVGTVIGQPTGQATQTVGDSFRWQLPNSHIAINTSYKIFEGPCELSFVDGFQPHHYVKYAAEELRTGIDKELELVRTLIR